ncbi:hypothetical protein vseg_006884 [Gypsophila vaccaria]
MPNLPQNSQYSQNFDFDNNARKSVGIPTIPPPISPYSQIPVPRPGSQSFVWEPSHSRPLSQPSLFLNDSLPPLSPPLYQNSMSITNGGDDVNLSSDCLVEGSDRIDHSVLPLSPFGRGNSLHMTKGLPPRKLHRRSISEIPFGFDSVMRSTLPRVPTTTTRIRGGGSGTTLSSGEYPSSWKAVESTTKRELSWGNTVDGDLEGEVLDDMLSSFINLDSIDAINSSVTDDKNIGENPRASGSKKNGRDSTENDAESCVNESGGNRGPRPIIASSGEVKGNATGEVALTTRHNRSVSMDSFMANMSFSDESPQLPPSPNASVQQLFLKKHVNLASHIFGSALGYRQFTADDMEKIMSNEKLAEIALNDPKRAKRILANRQSAARSKERKMRYISELEHKVQTLESEATTLSTRVTSLQRDSSGLASQNKELKFRLRALEQQSYLQNSLNVALTAEAQRLKAATGELNLEPVSTSFEQQLYINPQLFQLQPQLLSQNTGQDFASGLGTNNDPTHPNL